jgi:ATP-dependent Clp protease ATP-binding subunit ClpA
VLENLGANPSNIRTQVVRMVGENRDDDRAVVGPRSSNNKTPTLEEYGTNLTKLVEEGKLDPVVGRQLQALLLHASKATTSSPPSRVKGNYRKFFICIFSR